MRSIRYFLKSYIHLFVFIFLIVISVLLIINAQNNVIKNIKSYGLTFFSSFQFGFSGISNTFSGISDYFGDLKKVEEELALTQKKLRESYDIIDEIEDLQMQNRKLRAVIGYFFTIPSLYDRTVKVIPAQVIAKQPGNYAFSITINKGKKDGVRVNMPVIAPYGSIETGEHQGLVGKTVVVGESTSVVLPLYNDAFYISALFKDIEYEGLVNGLGENTDHVLMQYVEKNAKADIKYGDLVVSSGLGQLYPRGIHIGTVKAIKAKPYETSMECEIEPVVKFSRLENVFVVMRDKSIDN
ncbi:MAG: rod shape-determining protein MreC [Spirochaetales bacterium]|nr:rod shape-determining protein MreC [Spirochaetales bacterium]